MSDLWSLCAEPLLWAMLCGSLGVCLLVPRGSRRSRIAGALLAAIGLGLLAASLPLLGDWVHQVLFWVLAGATAASAVATISMRSPVYSAIWFALTLLTTAGLFLLQGAQFLGVATVVVYAGAILVTFLFVLMLAQPQGDEIYDRVGWGWLPTVFASLAAVLIVGGLTYVVGNSSFQVASTSASSETAPHGVMNENHMATFGGRLFSRHLVSVEVAGTLLLAALVGAVAIAIQGKQQRQSGEEEAVGAGGEGGTSDA